MSAARVIGLVAPAAVALNFAETVERFARTVSISEAGDGEWWRIEGIATQPVERAAVEAAVAVTAAALGLAAPAVAVTPLPERDWLAANRQSFPAMRIGRFHVRGSHIAEPPPPGAVPLLLDAASAFGSGEHATTRGCLLAIDRLASGRRLQAVLDVGCGSGILALAAARVWPARVVASDVDPDAVAAAAGNARRNGLGNRVRVVQAAGLGHPAIVRRCYDLILANILARPLMRMAGGLARQLRPGGRIVLSGLLARQERQVLAAYAAQRLRLERRIAISGWHTLVLRRGRR